MCILYIDLPYAHYAGDVTIIQYIVYSMLISPPLLCVLGCDIALAGSGYITSSSTKLRFYILYIGIIENLDAHTQEIENDLSGKLQVCHHN